MLLAVPPKTRLLLLFLLACPLLGFGQAKTPAAFGYRHLRDTVDVLQERRRAEAQAHFILEHNFAGFTNGQVDYEKWHCDRVARDFFAWMNTH